MHCRRGNAVFAHHIGFVRMILLFLTFVLAMPAVAAPSLRALSNWQPGQWQSKGSGGQAPVSMCLQSPDLLLLAGRANASCRFSTIEDATNAAVVTYQCSEGRQGRTELRRDTAELYTINTQGLEGGRPFAGRTEWKRLGSC